MARLHVVLTPIIVVVWCVVVMAHSTTPGLLTSLTPPHKAAGGIVKSTPHSAVASQDVLDWRALSRLRRQLRGAYQDVLDRRALSRQKKQLTEGTSQDVLDRRALSRQKRQLREGSQDVLDRTVFSRQKRQLTGSSQDVSDKRVLIRRKRQLEAASNWLKRLYYRAKYYKKKIFQSELWGKLRYISNISTIFIVMSTKLHTIMQIAGMEHIGSISTYLDFFWVSYDLGVELKDYADEHCYYPIYWPISKLTPEHCNPYLELLLLQEEDEEASQGEDGEQGNYEGDEQGNYEGDEQGNYEGDEQGRYEAYEQGSHDEDERGRHAKDNEQRSYEEDSEVRQDAYPI